MRIQIMVITVLAVTFLQDSLAFDFHAEHSILAAEYQQHFNEWAKKGYILKYVTGFENENKQVMYNTIWHKNTAGTTWKSFHGLTESGYQKNFDTQVRAGYWPVFVDGFTTTGPEVGTVPRMTVIYHKVSNNSGAKAARHGQKSAQYQASFDEFVGEKGYDLRTVSQYELAGTSRYASLFEQDSGARHFRARHGMTASQYQTAFNEAKEDGFGLVHVSASTITGGSARFAAIWEKQTPRYLAFHGVVDIQAKIDDVVPKGYVPAVIDGYLEQRGGTRFALLFVKIGENLETPKANAETFSETSCFDQKILDFMVDNDIPGANTAVMKDGKIVYAQGYGTRDVPGIGSGEVEVRKAMPYTPFRLASVSKPITSLAVMRLVQRKDLKVSDKVFGSGGILQRMSNNAKPCCPIVDNRIYDVTVEHLLRHTGGWDRDLAFDPMFRSDTVSSKLNQVGPASCEDVIYYMFNQPMQHSPGSTYAYSNFGYCILGRVIEKITGKDYESAVRDLFLDPAGVSAAEMYQGKTQLKDIPSHEAEYYCPGCALKDSVFPSETDKVPNPYGAWHLEAMDAHGAWVASPQELMKVMSFTASPHCNGTDVGVNDHECLLWTESWDDLLSKASIYDGGDVSWYGYGFSTRTSSGDYNVWHSGSLPGTRTILVRTNENYGYAWALNFNVRGFEGNMDSLMWDAVGCVGTWPSDFEVEQLPKDEADSDKPVEVTSASTRVSSQWCGLAGMILFSVGLQLV